MGSKNKFATIVGKIQSLPGMLETPVLSRAIGRVIPFAGTAGIRVEKLTPTEAVVSIRNRRRVRNHIGGVHAAAMALLAESATGFVCGMSVPDDKVLVIKTLKVDFVKRATGALRAVARVTDAQVEEMKSTEKGEVSVGITVTDEADVEPIKCEMIWAWTPKRR